MSDEPDNISEDDGEMTWETHAREAIESAASDVEHDEIRGVIYLPSGVDHRFNTVQEGFISSEDLRQRLIEIGEDEWVTHVPFESGEALFEPNVEHIVDDIMARHDIEAFFERVAPPDEGAELAIARDLVSPRAGPVIQIDAAEINDELVHFLAEHPEKMHDLTPRRFEELVAELFKDKGYDVELTLKSRDGGFDIRAFRRNDIGTCLTLIECKRYAPTNPVSVEIVRGIYGVAVNEGATNGIIATTSHFTKGAKSFQAKNEYRLHLADFGNLKLWLNAYKKGV